MTKIIGFSGKKQSGKNTSANFIYSLYMINQAHCQKAKINPQGLIDVVKNDNMNITIDVNEYYLNASNYIDQEMLDVINKLNSYIKIYSFADILKKNICMDLLDLTYEQCYGPDSSKNEVTNVFWENKYLTAREVMQFVGTDLFRAMKPNIWPESTIKRIQEDAPELALITDCRFPNEVDAIHSAGGIVIRLTKDKHLSSSHISETILDKNSYDWNNFDFILDNDNMSIYEQSMALYELLQNILA
jgi:hypothetical protein